MIDVVEAQEVLSPGDISQQYLHCVVLYKGEPVKVTAVGEGVPTKVNITNLKTQKKSSVLFNLQDFTPPDFRLGMLNTESGAVWVSRKPVRKMHVGLCKGNIVVEALPAPYLDRADRVIQSVYNLNSVELAECISGEYPDFRTCIEYVKEFVTTVAFERQFAIDTAFNIYYKTRHVGNLPKNCRTVERITFLKEYQHLHMALGDTCENTFSNLRN